jgi:hypothetical protein
VLLELRTQKLELGTENSERTQALHSGGEDRHEFVGFLAGALRLGQLAQLTLYDDAEPQE